jgi:predicted aspartyl protease
MKKEKLDVEKFVMQKCYIANPLNHNLGEQVSFMVDTGSTSIIIPTWLARKLKLKSVGEGEGILADGSKAPCDMAWIWVDLEGEGLLVIALVLENAEPILGLDVMKMLQLQIDPARERLLKPTKRFSLLHFLLKRGAVSSKTSSSKP